MSPLRRLAAMICIAGGAHTTHAQFLIEGLDWLVLRAPRRRDHRPGRDPDARSSYALAPLARERLAQLLAPPIYALPLSPLDPRVAARLAAERRARGR